MRLKHTTLLHEYTLPLRMSYLLQKISIPAIGNVLKAVVLGVMQSSSAHYDSSENAMFYFQLPIYTITLNKWLKS